MEVAVLIGSFFALVLLGLPIAVSLGGATMIAAFTLSPIPLPIIGQKLFSNLDHFTLMAVPFFFFAAALMESGGLVRRLVGLANAIVGHLRGGLGMTTVLACIFFAAISGSSPATVAAVGNLMYPALLKEGYTKRYAIGALATAGSIGILIPPSIPMILYGFITETSIVALFIAGIVPGLIYGGLMMITARILAGSEGHAVRERATGKEFGTALRSSLPALSLPLFIVIGIYGFPELEIGTFYFDGGAIFTPTEAAVMSSLLAIIIGRFVYKELTLSDFGGAIIVSAARVGTIFWIAVNAIMFGYFVTKLGIPAIITEFIISLDLAPWQFLLVVNIVLVIIGFFLEGVPTILIFVPILFPAAQAMGIDPVHFGIIVVVNIELGLITPPVGLNLFVGASISGMSVVSVFRATLPWMISTIITLVLVTYIPDISLFLPSFMKF